MKQGESVECTIACKPNDKNARDLDIVIDYSFDGDCMKANRKQQAYRLR